MKKLIFALGIVVSLFSLSCSEKKQKQVDNYQSLETDFLKWWQYHNDSIHLTLPFVSLDSNGNQIPKKDFLSELNSGSFIPIKLENKENIPKYQLLKLTKNANPEIRKTIKNTSKKIYQQNELIGKEFPNFNFEDLNGRIYNNDRIRGKTVILKCWFINCKPCIQEFPILNEYVIKNKREDVLFLSLAIDNEFKLKEFLKLKKFEYEVVPNQEQFMENDLLVQAYPTHIIIDKNGQFIHVSSSAEEMISALENNLLIESKKLPPPPPPIQG